MKRFLIIVEGEADKRFMECFYHHLFHQKAPEGSIIHPGKDNDTGGYTKLRSEDALGAMRQNSDLDGINLVVFDADENPDARRNELLAIQQEAGVAFELFLLPNNTDPGELEDMLENIINPDNQPVMDCWASYEDELSKVRIPTKNPPTLTIPAKKTKIYAYLESLLGKSSSQKKLAKDPYRNYENPQHWDLNSMYLDPLRAFLIHNLESPEEG